MNGPRVRFAPSPTGYFHVGSARTALFNWFVARQSSSGVFILRVEDTDASRDREEWVEGIYDAMAWLGFTLDEGPFRQSDSEAAHDSAAQLLRRTGYLYYCDCSPAMIDERKGPGATPGYDGHCRDLASSGVPRRRCAFAPRARGSPSCTTWCAATSSS